MPNIECKENPDVPIVKVIEKGNLLLNSNSYGFKGRSPYVSNTNTRPKGTNSNTNNTNNSKMNSNQKIINGFIFTELKDKVFEYRCSVCNFVAHANGELHKHLTISKHFIFRFLIIFITFFLRRRIIIAFVFHIMFMFQQVFSIIK